MSRRRRSRVVLTAEFDPLRDEGEAYAARLTEADVPVSVIRYPGQIHGFMGFFGMLDDATAALGAVVDAVRSWW